MTDKSIDGGNDDPTTEAPVAHVDPKTTVFPNYEELLMLEVMNRSEKGSGKDDKGGAEEDDKGGAVEDPNAPKEKPVVRVSKKTFVPTEKDLIEITQKTVMLQAERQAAAQAALDGTPTKKIKIISLEDLRNMNNKE
ncbi:hypothetical protein C0416_04850 [bacterium]|nr:hypothetical protein [bacterium]